VKVEMNVLVVVVGTKTMLVRVSLQTSVDMAVTEYDVIVVQSTMVDVEYTIVVALVGSMTVAHLNSVAVLKKVLVVEIGRNEYTEIVVVVL
jgi:hypothetical protein